MNSTTQIHKRPENNNPTPNYFNSLLTETVDSTFAALGDTCKQTLYTCIEKRYRITRETISSHPATFAHALEEIFGQAAFLLETKIMQTLNSKVQGFKYSPKQDELSFADYLEHFCVFLQRPPHF
jgi:hypothetical protein